MKPVGVDRILVLTGTCLVLIVLAFTGLFLNTRTSKRLGPLTVIETESTLASARRPLESRARAVVFSDWTRAFAVEARTANRSLSAGSFYDATALVDFAGRSDLDHLVRESLVAPAGLRATEQAEPAGILLEWNANPSLAAIGALVAKNAGTNAALQAGFRVDRWRAGEEPAVIATVPFDRTSYLDGTVGPRGGAWTYRVRAFVAGKASDGSRVAEERKSDLVSVSRSEAFDLALVAGDTTKVTLEVTVTVGTGKKSARFEARRGERIGSSRDVDGMAVDFSTGLTVSEIAELDDVRELTVRHPLFNPDGSRRIDENGLVYRDEVRKVPVRRLEVRVQDSAGATRALSIDR